MDIHQKHTLFLKFDPFIRKKTKKIHSQIVDLEILNGYITNFLIINNIK